MNKQIRAISTIIMLTLTLGSLSLPLFGKPQKMVIGRKGTLYLNSSVWAGDKLLKWGTYQVQHVVEGNDHVIVIKDVPSGASHRGNTIPGKEVARLMCKLEPSNKEWKNTMIMLRTNAKGEKEISEIHVAGEKFIHLL